MELLTASLNNGILTLGIHGRIDSSNAPEAEKKITEFRAANPADNVIVDAQELEYISSAGLRVILRLRKAVPELKIINVSSEVYEIFDMTGFTEMINIEKAYRVLSVDGCEVIGRGANGIVYRYDPDTIIKVYFNSDALDMIQNERELARKAFVLGIPTAISYDVVRVGDSYGSVFELLNANTLEKIYNADPSKIDDIVTIFVDLLKKIHSTEIKPDDMPDMKKTVVGWVDFLKDYLDADKWKKLSSLVAAVPDDNHMIHGDYHLKNVMVQNGEVLLIDMDTLAHGNPVFEFASIFNAFVGFSILEDDDAMTFIDIPNKSARLFWDKTIRRYFETDDKARLDDITDKSALIGYSRLMRRLIRRNGLDTEDGRRCIEYYKKQIEEILDRVDTLTF